MQKSSFVFLLYTTGHTITCCTPDAACGLDFAHHCNYTEPSNLKKLRYLSQIKKTTLSLGCSSSTTLMLAPQFTKMMYCICKAGQRKHTVVHTAINKVIISLHNLNQMHESKKDEHHFCPSNLWGCSTPSYEIFKYKESSQGESLYHQHDKSTKTQMAWACSPT